MGLNLGVRQQPPRRDLHDGRRVFLPTSTTRRQDSPQAPTTRPRARSHKQNGRPTSIKRTAIAARALPFGAGGSGRVREAGRQHEECTPRAVFNPPDSEPSVLTPLCSPRSLPLSSTTWLHSLRRRYSTAYASSSERQAWCSRSSRRASTASSCSRKSTGATRRSIEGASERKICQAEAEVARASRLHVHHQWAMGTSPHTGRHQTGRHGSATLEFAHLCSASRPARTPLLWSITAWSWTRSRA